ncbi:GlxA family transcriptional regulator [Candidatus Sororendozoicomonas aggregata]|uniref:GlxA family transcriptional regulator n=1 Tax=Candidatus Sororendozoicomonas aggregata TaxID=3073239 RepID=UPI002ECFCE5C
MSNVQAKSRLLAPPVDSQPVTFLLLPGFSLISFSSAIEPLFEANNQLGRKAYHSRTVSVDGRPAQSTSGVNIQVDSDLPPVNQDEIIFLCGADKQSDHHHDGNHLTLRWLKAVAPECKAVGAIGCGLEVLACSGLLDGYSATHFSKALLDYKKVRWLHYPVEIDRNRYTCQGGQSSLDLMLALIKQHHGALLCDAVAEVFYHEPRGYRRQAFSPVKEEGMASAPDSKLREALDLMRANIEEPLGSDELASHVGVSRRQLERLFRENLQTTPSRYYLQLRLERARRLLKEGDASIVQVALAAGFSNASHFSTAYRNHFQLTPRIERQRSRDLKMVALKRSLSVNKD